VSMINILAPGLFNGKQPATDYLDMPASSFGPQKYTIGQTKIFVCPSTRTGSDPRWWEPMAKTGLTCPRFAVPSLGSTYAATMRTAFFEDRRRQRPTPWA
jgi:hypothetical protein